MVITRGNKRSREPIIKSSSSKPIKKGTKIVQVVKRKPQQKMIKLDVVKYQNKTYKQAVGNAAEDLIQNCVHCQTCGKKHWKNLNDEQHNCPGVDLLCLICGDVIQIKAKAVLKNGELPLTMTSTGAYKIPTSKNTVKETLKKYRGKVRYIAVLYNADDFTVNQIAISNILSCKDIHHSGNYIVSNDTLWLSGLVK